MHGNTTSTSATKSPAVSWLDVPVWGIGAIAGIINRSRRATFTLLKRGELKGCVKIGGKWSALPRAVLADWTGE